MDTNKKLLKLEQNHFSKSPYGSNPSEYEIVCDEEALGSQLDPSKRGNLKNQNISKSLHQ